MYRVVFVFFRVGWVVASRIGFVFCWTQLVRRPHLGGLVAVKQAGEAREAREARQGRQGLAELSM